MRKKIFVIHGFGIKDGIGWEAGGDLDTVSSNVFYTVWAENEIRKQKGSEAVRGVDYDYDFVNYSEGLSHLIVHSGCDVYIPDFPIDALSPRLELMYLPDPDAAPLINEFNRKFFDLKIWMTKNSGDLDDYFKKIFNSSFKQKIKVLEHPEPLPLKVAIAVVDIVSASAEISVLMKKNNLNFIEPYLKALAQNIAGAQLKEAKKYIVDLMGGYLKEEQMDLLDDEDALLKIEKSNEKDYSAKGRINYTDDLIIIAVESMSYILRNQLEAKTFKYNKQNSERLTATALEIAGTVAAIFKNIESTSAEFLKNDAIKSLREINHHAETIRAAALSVLSLAEKLKGVSVTAQSELVQKLTVILMEHASGKVVEGVKIMFKKVLGEGHFLDSDGNKINDTKITAETNANGTATVSYVKPKENEEFQISATYDEVKYLMIPEEIINAADSEYAEEVLEEEDEDSQIDMAMNVSLQLLEKQFRELIKNDVNIASITDHHPYTKVVYDLLSKLHIEKIIQEFDIQASVRGVELPIEQQVCGANIVYRRRIAGQEFDVEGLKSLNNLARMQDLHIQKIPLAISISKLIGSKHSKLEMVQKLSKLTDKKSLEEIMQSTGWSDIVDDYERRLSMVLPRAEGTVGRIKLKSKITSFQKFMNGIMKKLGKKDMSELEIMACLSPFCDPRKNEPQINVASAIEHIISKKRKKADYFFYCYGSNIMTQRKMDNKDERINLSMLSQFIGTRADGGHSGASSCKPVSNPNFPKKRLASVRENNFCEYLYYIGANVSRLTGFELDGVKIVSFDELSAGLMKNLEKLDASAAELTLKCGWKRKKILIVKSPKFDAVSRDDVPSFFQIASYLDNKYRFDYLFLIQGPLNKILMASTNDNHADIDLEKVAQKIGWRHNHGNKHFAIATPKRNKKISKELRFTKEEQFYQLCSFLSKIIESSLLGENGETKWKIHSLLAPRLTKMTKEWEEFASKLKFHLHEVSLISSDKKKNISVLVVAEPYVEGVKSPSLTQAMGLLRRVVHLELSKYLLYIKRASVHLINLGDDDRSINCQKAAASSGAGENILNSDIFCTLEMKTISMPVGFEKITKGNSKEYIKLMLEKLCAPSGFSVSKVEKKSI